MYALYVLKVQIDRAAFCGDELDDAVFDFFYFPDGFCLESEVEDDEVPGQFFKLDFIGPGKRQLARINRKFIFSKSIW